MDKLKSYKLHYLAEYFLEYLNYDNTANELWRWEGTWIVEILMRFVNNLTINNVVCKLLLKLVSCS